MQVLMRCGVIVIALAAITYADPLNGDFEAGTDADPLKGWIQGDDGGKLRVTSTSVGDFSPISGSQSGFVHNGPDDLGFTGVLTSSPIIVPTLGGTLSFAYNFVTAEFTGLDAFALDYFEVWLDDVLNPVNNTRLLYGDVSGANGDGDIVYSFDFILPSWDAASAPDGTSYYEETGLQTYSSTLTAGSYRLRFLVEDVADPDYPDEASWFDSGLLIDDVSFVANKPAPPIPEPSTLALVALGGLAAFFARRRRRD